MSPVAGWYTDPASPARLRWWDGATWTDQTRDHQTHAAPPPPTTAGAAPPPPPTAPGSAAAGPGSSTTDPGSFPYGSAGSTYGSGTYGSATYGSGSYGATPPGYTPPGSGAPGSGPAGPGSAYSTPTSGGYGFAGPGMGYGAAAGAGPGTPGGPAGPAGPGGQAESKRAWVSWASIGAAIAVALAVIIILSVSLIGHSSNVASTQGLSNNTTPGQATTTTAGPPTTTVPPGATTTLPGPPPDSTPFADPGGIYSMDVNTAWETPASQLEGIQQWYLTGVNYGGYRSSLAILAQSTGVPTALSEVVQGFESGLTRSNALHVTSSSNVTLADGTPGVVVFYTASADGQTINAEALVAVKGVHAVVVTVQAAADASASTFVLVDPYLQTLHIN